jgi:hypothetical protein
VNTTIVWVTETPVRIWKTSRRKCIADNVTVVADTCKTNYGVRMLASFPQQKRKGNKLWLATYIRARKKRFTIVNIIATSIRNWQIGLFPT